jgi:hypothetical protein
MMPCFQSITILPWLKANDSLVILQNPLFMACIFLIYFSCLKQLCVKFVEQLKTTQKVWLCIPYNNSFDSSVCWLNLYFLHCISSSVQLTGSTITKSKVKTPGFLTTNNPWQVAVIWKGIILWVLIILWCNNWPIWIDESFVELLWLHLDIYVLLWALLNNLFRRLNLSLFLSLNSLDR